MTIRPGAFCPTAVTMSSGRAMPRIASQDHVGVVHVGVVSVSRTAMACACPVTTASTPPVASARNTA